MVESRIRRSLERVLSQRRVGAERKWDLRELDACQGMHTTARDSGVGCAGVDAHAPPPPLRLCHCRRPSTETRRRLRSLVAAPYTAHQQRHFRPSPFLPFSPLLPRADPLRCAAIARRPALPTYQLSRWVDESCPSCHRILR